MMAEYADMFTGSHLKFFLFLVAMCVGVFGTGWLISFYDPLLKGHLGGIGFVLMMTGYVCIAIALFVVASPLLTRVIFPLVICILGLFRALLLIIQTSIDQVIRKMTKSGFYPNESGEKPKHDAS